MKGKEDKYVCLLFIWNLKSFYWITLWLLVWYVIVTRYTRLITSQSYIENSRRQFYITNLPQLQKENYTHDEYRLLHLEDEVRSFLLWDGSAEMDTGTYFLGLSQII